MHCAVAGLVKSSSPGRSAMQVDGQQVMVHREMESQKLCTRTGKSGPWSRHILLIASTLPEFGWLPSESAQVWCSVIDGD